MRVIYAVTAFLLLAGSLFVTTGTAEYLRHRSLARSGVTTTAEVVDARTVTGRRGATSHIVTARYTSDQEAHVQDLTVSSREYARALSEGHLAVRYDPARPESAVPADATPSVGLPLAGLILLGLGVASVARLTVMRREATATRRRRAGTGETPSQT